MKKTASIIVFMLSGLFSALYSGLAQSEGQFYFLAKPGNTAAAAQSGQTETGVYLRWDVLEGELPDDVQGFRLERDGVLVGREWGVDELMTEQEVRNMYNEAGQQQRLMHTLTLLKETLLSEGGQDFEPEQYAKVLSNRLANANNAYWNFLASRQNFNIARARYRAYLDSTVTANTEYVYTLSVIQKVTGNPVIIGQATVNTGNNHQLLAVQELKQLGSRCDSSQDHFTVALDWSAPGNTLTDQVAGNVQLAGYEIYRSSENITATTLLASQVKVLAQEAKTLLPDGRGEVVFPGLERVNPQLLMLEGDGDPLSFEFLEDARKLKIAGLKPGDRRAYYVVGRDFSDHYGETAVVIVQVPNQLSPEMPWDVSTGYRGGESPGIQLSWDAVNVDNFKVEYPRRVICNPAEAEQTGMLEYASTVEQCATPSIARLDVTGYRLYRFDNALDARGFKDSDGDGVADIDEADAGLECSPDQQPPTAADYSITPLQLSRYATRDGDRLSFIDSGDHLQQGQFYYYWLASEANGKLSHVSGPHRVLYPDTTPPAEPTFEIVIRTTGDCCVLEALNANQVEWQFDDAIGLHNTISLAENQTQTEPVPISNFGFWSTALCSLEAGGIAEFWGTGPGRRLIYPGQYVSEGKNESNEPIYCEVEIPETMNLCKSGHWQMYESQCQTDEPVVDGRFYGEGEVVITMEAGDIDSCVEHYQTVAGEQVLVASSCGTDTPWQLESTIEAGMTCGYLLARDSSNNASAPVQLPCSQIQTERTPPSPPQLTSLEALSDHLTFSWRSPLQPTAATMLEITSDIGSQDDQLLSFPANMHEPGFEFNESSNVHTLVGHRDQWCIRAMAVGLAGAGQTALHSDWSGPLCRTRRENGASETEYLPWPKIQPLEAGAPLKVELAADYVSELQDEDPQHLPILLNLSSFNNLFKAPDAGGVGMCFAYDEFDPLNPERHYLLVENFSCRTSGRNHINAQVETPFLVYRQARTPTGDAGPWIQVSPLIQSIKWNMVQRKDGLISVLKDPYFSMYRYEYSSEQHLLPWHLGFVDRYPYILGYQYRYQMVIFSELHAIESLHLSNWISTSNAQ